MSKLLAMGLGEDHMRGNEDLCELNRRFINLNGDPSRTSLSLVHAVVCVARYTGTAAELEACLAGDAAAHGNVLEIVALNRDYLNYARLISRDALRSHAFLLVELHLTIELARFFAGLTNSQIAKLASHWPGPIATLQDDPKANRLFDRVTGSFYAATLVTALQ